MDHNEADSIFQSGDITDVNRISAYYQNIFNSTDCICQCINCGLVNINTGVQATSSCTDGVNINIRCNQCGNDSIEFLR